MIPSRAARGGDAAGRRVSTLNRVPSTVDRLFRKDDGIDAQGSIDDRCSCKLHETIQVWPLR